MIQAQSRGGRIDAVLVRVCTAGGRKVLSALIAHIGFRRLDSSPIGSSLGTTTIDRNQFVAGSAVPCLSQQLLNYHLCPFVLTFAELMVSNMPIRVYEVESRPSLVVE